MRRYDTVVVSDLHLGAPNARCDSILRFLETIETPRLIIAGDLFESPVLRGLQPKHLRVLDAIRVYAREHEVIFLRGNHDPSMQYCRAVLGIPGRDEIVIDVGGRSYLVYHGHEWDSSLLLPPWLISVADTVYHASQRIDRSHSMARYLKRRCKKFCHSVEKLESRALAAARERGLSGVILGHTHVAGDYHIDGLHYLNTGCWTEKPSAFVGIRDGVARRYFWESIVRRENYKRTKLRRETAAIAKPIPALSGAST